MGTHACTRIQSKDDYIELHTRWDGFTDEIKNDIKGLNQEWLAAAKFVLERTALLNDEHPLKYLETWAKNVRSFAQRANSIEKISTLLSARCFVHHHILPHANQASEDTLSYWGAGSPDVVAILDQAGEIKFNKKKTLKKITPKPVAKEWNLIRIEDANEEGTNYMYLKTKLDNPAELYDIAFKLPFFWRDFHMLCRIPFLASEGVSKPIVKFSRKIAEFYNNTDYTAFHVERDFKSKMEHVSNLIPFDMWINTFSTHLFMQNPGVFEPLTFAEDQHEYKVIGTFILDDSHHRLTTVSVSTNLAKPEVQKRMKGIEEKQNAHEQAFSQTYGIEAKRLNLSKLSGINYEANLIKLLEGIEEFDAKSQKKMSLKP